MAPLEVAAGWVPGHETGSRPAEVFADEVWAEELERARSPRQALERSLLPALQRTPCVVAFSGGRDSSAMLALVVALARREGLPLPVALTKRYPKHPETDESRWQELVVRHLGVEEWVRLPFDTELDLVGPVASTVLRRHGLVWPPPAYGRLPLLDVAAGGSLVDGEGGDEVFGIRRVTPLKHTLAGKLRPGRPMARLLAESIGPRPLRRSRLRRKRTARTPQPWLRPEARAAFVEALVVDDLDEPFSWIGGARRLLVRRAWVYGSRTMALLAEEADVYAVHPLLDPVFIESLRPLAGRLGFTSRRAAMAALFGDLLPPEVIRRQDKVAFNGVVFSRYSRDFVRTWDGSGVDADLVDPERLGEEWRAPVPNAGTSALLQAAWLAQQPSGTREESLGLTAGPAIPAGRSRAPGP